ncbi:MAG: hypothetical protein K6E40_13365 [Desulfovibrio sp.]|nr:hypothetical protein [Desulfovibrio sp.]
MRLILSTLVLATLAATFFSGRAEALSEAEYGSYLRSDPKIASLDRELNREFKKAIVKIRQESQFVLRDDQREWLRKREALVQRIMRDRGIRSKSAAIAVLLESRIGYLKCFGGHPIGKRKTYMWLLREGQDSSFDWKFCERFDRTGLDIYNDRDF